MNTGKTLFAYRCVAACCEPCLDRQLLAGTCR